MRPSIHPSVFASRRIVREGGYKVWRASLDEMMQGFDWHTRTSKRCCWRLPTAPASTEHSSIDTSTVASFVSAEERRPWARFPQDCPSLQFPWQTSHPSIHHSALTTWHSARQRDIRRLRASWRSGGMPQAATTGWGPEEHHIWARPTSSATQARTVSKLLAKHMPIRTSPPTSYLHPMPFQHARNTCFACLPVAH